jgi:hypothetical protein
VVQRSLLWLMRGLLTVGASLLSALTGTWGNGTMDMAWLLIVGVLFIIALMLVPWAFKKLGLDDKTQAMGLPDGSIRSIIALTLILLFGVLPVYLFNRVAGGGMLPPIAGLSTEAQSQAAQSYKDYSPIFVKVVPDQNKPNDVTYTMYFRQPADPSGVDFAKQMLVLLGTLATSVASFYFGSKTATSAASSAATAANAAVAAGAAAQGGGPAPKPVLTGLSTDPAQPTLANGKVHFTLNLQGSNLNDVKTIRIESGTTDRFSFASTSNDTVATCVVDCAPTVAAGSAWGVVVVDGAGQESDPLSGHLTF